MDNSRAEFLAKLDRIREQAQATLDEFPARLARERLHLIIALARYLSTTLEADWAEATIPDTAASAKTRNSSLCS